MSGSWSLRGSELQGGKRGRGIGLSRTALFQATFEIV